VQKIYYDWDEYVEILIHSIQSCTAKKKSRCSILLCGGRGGKKLYKSLQLHPSFKNLFNIDLYFGDERCVSTENKESNYNLVINSLFPNGFPLGFNLYPMYSSEELLEVMAERYSMLLPSTIDIVILGMGNDGHVASLYPFHAALYEVEKSAIVVYDAPSIVPTRITITPNVIRKGREVFVLAVGSDKKKVLDELNSDPNNYYEMPARLALNGIWYVGEQ
jgi:6-phosphogluconolactonase